MNASCLRIIASQYDPNAAPPSKYKCTTQRARTIFDEAEAAAKKGLYHVDVKVDRTKVNEWLMESILREEYEFEVHGPVNATSTEYIWSLSWDE